MFASGRRARESDHLDGVPSSGFDFTMYKGIITSLVARRVGRGEKRLAENVV